jgi:hypothetical protein
MNLKTDVKFRELREILIVSQQSTPSMQRGEFWQLRRYDAAVPTGTLCHFQFHAKTSLRSQRFHKIICYIISNV